MWGKSGFLSIGRLNLLNTELSQKRYWRGPRSQDVGEGWLSLDWLVNLNCSTPSCFRRGTGRDRDPRMQGKKETIPNATLSPLK